MGLISATMQVAPGKGHNGVIIILPNWDHYLENQINTSLSLSPLAQLSEDKQWLRRVAPLPSLSSADVDSRTIYVENLSPHGTDHDSVRNMFKSFGNITYVR